MPKLWKKTDNLKDSTDLVEVPLPVSITSPTIIFLSGRETTDKNPKEISKNIRYLNKNVPEGTKVYTWSHGGQLSRTFATVVYTRFSKFYRPSAKRLAGGTILPLVTNADGKPLPFEEAKKNLRNLTLLGYSAGSILAQELFNASFKLMKKSGYNKTDARRLPNEVVLVTIGTISRPTKEKNRFTTLSLANSDDWFVRLKNLAGNPLKRIFMNAGRRRQLRIRPVSDTSLLITAAARKRPWHSKKKEQEIINGVHLQDWHLMTSNHEAVDYINMDDAHSQLARIVPYALANAINRTDTVTPQQLMQPPADEQEEIKTAYQAKIQTALMNGQNRKRGM